MLSTNVQTEEERIYHVVYGFAYHAHQSRALTPEKRFRKNGRGQNSEILYITHPVAVKDDAIHRANDYYPAGSRNVFLISLVAILHDVLEDTAVTKNELQTFLMELLPFADAVKVMDAVLLLTKDGNNFNIITYLHGIRLNPFATIVKLSDLDHNMSDLKPGNLLDKYKLCHYFLTQ